MTATGLLTWRCANGIPESVSELATVAIDSRTRMLADNVTDNNMLLSRLKERGKMELVDGGLTILEEIEYAENQTVRRFSGYEPVDVSPSDVFTSAQFDGREIAAAVTISQREKNQTMGKAGMIALLKNRVKNAEKSMVNTLASDVYSDGSADGGKQVDGLQLAVPTANTAAAPMAASTGRPGNSGARRKTTGVASDGSNIYAKMLEPVAFSVPGHRQAGPDRLRQQLSMGTTTHTFRRSSGSPRPLAPGRRRSAGMRS